MVYRKNHTNNDIFLSNLYHAFYASPTAVNGADIKEIIKVDIKLDEPDIKDYIKAECQKRDLDYRIVYAVIEVESNWQADTIGDQGESFGLGQVQPRWHSDRMTKLGVTDLLNPYDNSLVVIDILDELVGKYGLDRGLNAYNSGNPDCYNGYAERVKEKFEKIREQ